MRKLFFLSGLMIFASIHFAQAQNEQIEDGGFETNWKTMSALGRQPSTYFDFNTSEDDLLRTLNSLYAIEVQEFKTELTSFKETNNPRGGSNALRMETVSFQGVITVPGAFGTISPDFISEFLRDGSIGVLTFFESRPKRLTGYYKYAPVNNDSASIEIELFNWDTRLAFSLWKEKNTVSTWTKFEIPLTYTNDWADVTDLKLIFSSSAAYNFNDLMHCRGSVGSKFWIDDIAFEYGDAGLVEPLLDRTASKAYPNPAATTVTISFDKPLEGQLVMYNILGAEVICQPVNGNSVEANISQLAAGSYLYRVIEGNIIRTSGKIVVGD